MEFKSEYYNETQINSFIFSYGFKEGAINNKNIVESIFQNYKNHNLPISVNPMDYGILINKIILKDSTVYFLQNNNGIAVTFRKFEDHNLVEFFKDGTKLVNFRDEFISENKFIRILDNKKYYFENKKEILFTKEIKTKFISKLKTTKNLKNNFITFDIETYIKDNILIPFCISIFDGKSKKSFILNDFKNPEELILTALKSIMIRKYNRSNVYIHNMAKFDIIFLLKYLVKLGTVNPIIHKDRIISINFNFGKNGEYQLQFKDSLNILK
jgi:DNA polymerase type B, organellar and viral